MDAGAGWWVSIVRLAGGRNVEGITEAHCVDTGAGRGVNGAGEAHPECGQLNPTELRSSTE